MCLVFTFGPDFINGQPDEKVEIIKQLYGCHQYKQGKQHKFPMMQKLLKIHGRKCK
jgi:hypothetical protein